MHAWINETLFLALLLCHTILCDGLLSRPVSFVGRDRRHATKKWIANRDDAEVCAERDGPSKDGRRKADPVVARSFERYLSSRLDAVNMLEVRLDVTIIWCHVLCRGLLTEILTRPVKAVPGIVHDDLVIIFHLISSASALSVLWFGFGAFATGQFEGRPKNYDDKNGLWDYLRPTVTTVALAGPLWVIFDDPTLVAILVQSEDYLTSASIAESVGNGISTLLGFAATAIGARMISLYMP